MVGRIAQNKSQTYGFDAQTEQYVDMLSAGIVDPAKVVRIALQDAASIAGLMITTEAMVAELRRRRRPRSCQAAVWAAWTTDQRTSAGPPGRPWTLADSIPISDNGTGTLPSSQRPLA